MPKAITEAKNWLDEEVLPQCIQEEYIFRGTNKPFTEKKKKDKEVNSTIYRKWLKKAKLNPLFSSMYIEEKIVKKAKPLFPKNTSNAEILTDLRHFGGDTNLIDFTSSLYIALFFACNGEFERDGELILLSSKNAKKILEYDINYPQKNFPPIDYNKFYQLLPSLSKASQNRVRSQHSIFVYAPKGYIPKKEYEVITVPKDRKKPCLELLKKLHSIDEDSVFNDLIGFIQNKENFNIEDDLRKDKILYEKQGNKEIAKECQDIIDKIK